MQSPVPLLARMLASLDAVLAKGEAHCEARRVDPAVLADDRLALDMLPLRRQVAIACDHAKNGSARLAGQEAPRFADEEATLAELRDRVARTLAYLATIPEGAFAGAEGRPVRFSTGHRELSFETGADYLAANLLPNFFFHVVTAYAILRHRGVDIGKRDYLGV